MFCIYKFQLSLTLINIINLIIKHYITNIFNNKINNYIQIELIVKIVLPFICFQTVDKFL